MLLSCSGSSFHTFLFVVVVVFFLTDPEVALGWIWVERRSQRRKESTGSVRYDILLNNIIYCIVPLQHGASYHSAEFLILIGPGLIPITAALTLIQLQIVHIRKWYRFYSNNSFARTHLCKMSLVSEVKGKVLFSECIVVFSECIVFFWGNTDLKRRCRYTQSEKTVSTTSATNGNNLKTCHVNRNRPGKKSFLPSPVKNHWHTRLLSFS